MGIGEVLSTHLPDDTLTEDKAGSFLEARGRASSPGWQFSTGVLQELLKHATPDYLVRVTDLFSLTLSN